MPLSFEHGKSKNTLILNMRELQLKMLDCSQH